MAFEVYKPPEHVLKRKRTMRIKEIKKFLKELANDRTRAGKP